MNWMKTALRDLVRALLASVSALYIWRVPILLSGILFLLPLVSGNALVSGLYYLPDGDPFAPFAAGLLLAFLAAQIFMELRILQVHGPQRLGTDLPQGADTLSRRVARWSVSLVLALGPLVYNEWKVVNMATVETSGTIAFRSLAGIAIVAVLFGALVWWQNRTPNPHDAPIFRFRSLDPAAAQNGPPVAGRLERGVIGVVRKVENEGRGFLIDGHLRSGYLLTFVLVGMILTVYLIGYVVGARCHDCSDPGFTAFPYLLTMLSLIGWFFGLVCFVLDRHRIPAITSTAVVAFVFSFIPANGHYYPVLLKDATQLPPTSTAVFKGLLPGAIVISAEGGGILAAAWATQVLSGILEKLSPVEQQQFLSSVRLLSGVSGGSTGLMYFQTLCGRGQGATVTNDEIEAMRNAAVADGGLGWVGYGLVYHDLLRSLWPYSGYSLADRGQTLERAWQAELRKLMKMQKGTERLPTMRDLQVGVEDGTRPLMMWNSTVADSGRPMAITNFAAPEDDPDIASYYHLYAKKYDLDLTTAVRLSASFPYVSPMARPIANDKPVFPKLALCDGGYADNFGVAPAYLVLNRATNEFRNNIAKPVLWIQIRVSKPSPQDESQALASTVVGPIWTLYGVRSTGQRARLRRMNELACLQMKDKLRLAVFEYLGEGNPLSWILSTAQKGQITKAWTNGNWDSEIQDIRAFLAGAPHPQSTCQAMLKLTGSP